MPPPQCCHGRFRTGGSGPLEARRGAWLLDVWRRRAGFRSARRCSVFLAARGVQVGDARSRLSKIKRPVADWNSLKLHVFLLRLRVHLTIQKLVTAGSRPMIVCSCNVLSDHDVRATMHSEGGPARNPGEVHRCLGCSRKCGRCMHTIKNIMNEALCGAAERRAGS
ncbi:(2Fe-2S)-binding protein [Rhodopseudomonas sp. BR0C11]|uniref:(2Fe-2S)-binding protein n=1 Tax=Rhodopseudomonas sp. BR0C11 TaxID=2269370 RepID=UPI0032E01A6D